MGTFNRNARPGGGRNFGSRSFEGNRPQPQMFEAVCSNCGRDCEVPFRPTGSKPVLCRDCFRKSGGSQESRPENRSFNRPQFENRPTFEKRNDAPRRTEQPQYAEQFSALNAKLDRILNLLTPPVAPLESVLDKSVIEEIVEEVEVDKPKTTAKKTKSPKKATSSKKK